MIIFFCGEEITKKLILLERRCTDSSQKKEKNDKGDSGKERVQAKRDNWDTTYQFKDFGLTVLRLCLCLAQLRHEAFSRRRPLIRSFFCFVMNFHDAAMSSSLHQLLPR